MDVNIILIIVAAVIVANMIRGAVLGLLKLLFNLGAWIALLILIPQITDVVGGFILAFIISLIIINILGATLKIVDHIPVLNGMNRFLGVVGGAILGFMEVELGFLILSLFELTNFGQLCMPYIDQSLVLKIMYHSNFLLLLFS